MRQARIALAAAPGPASTRGLGGIARLDPAPVTGEGIEDVRRAP